MASGKNYIIKITDILSSTMIKGDIWLGMNVILRSQIISVIGVKGDNLPNLGSFMCYCELIDSGISAFIGDSMDITRKNLLKQSGEYYGIVVDCYDGDTITVDIDLGLNVVLKDQKIRMYGINAPEIRSRESHEKAVEARDHLRNIILDKRVKLTTRQCDKKCPYGRWLATVYCDGLNCSKEMLERGYAVPFMEEADP